MLALFVVVVFWCFRGFAWVEERGRRLLAKLGPCSRGMCVRAYAASCRARADSLSLLRICGGVVVVVGPVRVRQVVISSSLPAARPSLFHTRWCRSIDQHNKE